MNISQKLEIKTCVSLQDFVHPHIDFLPICDMASFSLKDTKSDKIIYQFQVGCLWLPYI